MPKSRFPFAAGALLAATFACAEPAPQPIDSSPAEGAPTTTTETSPVGDLTPFEAEDGRHGYRDAAGEIAIEPRFQMAQPFEDQVAAVVEDGEWAFIDRSGTRLAKAFVFDNVADSFVEGRARIVDDSQGAPRYGFVATSGEIAVAATWSFVLPYAEGLAAVCDGCVREQHGEHLGMTGGRWGYVDLDGAVVIEPRYESAGTFEDGRATVELEGRSFAIGRDGEPVSD